MASTEPTAESTANPAEPTEKPAEPTEKPPKKKKLTKAEKKLLRKMRLEELKMKVKRDEVITEVKNITKIIKQKGHSWVMMCNERQTPAIRDEVHAVWKAFEWANDSKDALIKELVDTLDKTDELEKKLFMDVDGFMKGQQNIFNIVATSTRTGAQENMKLFQNRKNIMQSLDLKNQNTVEYMKTINFCNTIANVARQEILLGNILSTKEEKRATNTSNYEIWMHKMIQKLRKLWANYNSVIHNYRSSTKPLEIKIKDLQGKVKNSDNVINYQEKQLKSLNSKIERYRRIIKKDEQSGRITTLVSLRKERTMLMEHLIEMKMKLKGISDNAADHLKTLASASTQTIKTLELIRNKGEQILKYHRMCVKLETEKEQERNEQRGRIKMQEAVSIKTKRQWQVYAEIEMAYKILLAKKTYLQRRNKYLEKKITGILNSKSNYVPPKYLKLKFPK